MSENEFRPSPAQAWQALLDGNARFVGGSTRHPHQDPHRRTAVASGQAPFAVVLGCMDSRVPVEIVLDQGLGDLAVVRSAGHAVDNAVLGSVEFGVTALRAPLVVVLGHDSCGAVKATLAAHRSGTLPGGFVRDVVEHVHASLLGAIDGGGGEPVTPDVLGVEHVRRTTHLLVERSPLISAAVASGECAVVGATYGLADGRVRLVDAIGDLEAAGRVPAHSAIA